MAIYKEDIVDIELESGVIHRTFLHHSIGLGDAKANRFGVRLFRNGEPDNIGTATLTALFMAPIGQNQIINESNFSGSTTIDGNVAYVTLPSVCYANEGQFCLAIKLNKSGVTTTMRIVDGMVANTGVTGATVPATPVPTSDQILAAYDAAVAMAQASVRFDTAQALETSEKKQARMNIDAAGNGIIAEEYSGTGRYAVGDYCIHDGNLYRCKKEITADTAWNASTYWTQCTAMGQVKTVIENVAKPWEANHAYTAGDYVSRDRKFYRMTVQPTTPDATWNSSHWTEVDVANDLEDRLNAEATARAEAVSAEATARANADSELKSAINKFSKAVIPYEVKESKYLAPSATTVTITNMSGYFINLYQVENDGWFNISGVFSGAVDAVVIFTNDSLATYSEVIYISTVGASVAKNYTMFIRQGSVIGLCSSNEHNSKMAVNSIESTIISTEDVYQTVIKTDLAIPAYFGYKGYVANNGTIVKSTDFSGKYKYFIYPIEEGDICKVSTHIQGGVSYACFSFP